MAAAYVVAAGSGTKDLEDDPRCHLFGPTALIVQAIMGVLVIASLVYKRQRECPRRKWKIWLFDVSKQVIGQAMLHGSNVFVSWLIGKRTLANPCVSYFLNILLDTTLGVLIIYSLLHLFTNLLTEKAHLDGLESGVYGDPPSPVWWFKQAAVYLFCLFIMKTIVIILLELFPWFMRAGKWLLSWTNSKNYVQVIFVMGVFPIAMNILQFWLIDSIVKFKTTFVDDAGPSSEDREPLVNGDDEEDEDTTDSRGPRASVDIERGSIRSRNSYSASTSVSSKTFSNLHTKENDDTSSSAPTSSSSRTVVPRRRSPPPEPSHAYTPSSSYGSIDANDATRLSRERAKWGLREEDDDEHAKWGRSLGQENDSDSASGTEGGRRRSASPTALKQWESWNMPVLSPPKKDQPLR